MCVSKAIGVVKDILCQFVTTTGVWFTGKHTCSSEDEDLKKVIAELSQRQVFFRTNVEERITCFHPLNAISF